MQHPQEAIMQKAIEEAKHSAKQGQYALGAVVVDGKGEVIAIAHTTLHEQHDPTCHAEVNAIRKACVKLESRYLPDCWLYTTLEPCPMCTSAAIWAKMKGIVFGATKDDALSYAKNSPSEKFTWRQIDIEARDIIAKGDPELNLVKGFMQQDCIKLFDYAN